MADSCIACALDDATTPFRFNFPDSQHTCEKGSNTSTSKSAEDGRYTFADYQDDTASTAIYPRSGEEDPVGINYTILGLIGEAGEIANKWKKFLRDSDQHPDDLSSYCDEISTELGDVLWYVSQLATELGVELGDVAAQNIQKLSARQKSGTIQGSGDNR